MIMTEEVYSSCVRCNHPIKIGSEDPCPNCGNSTPLFNKIGISEGLKTADSVLIKNMSRLTEQTIGSDSIKDINNGINKEMTVHNKISVTNRVNVNDKGKTRDLFRLKGYRFEPEVKWKLVPLFLILFLITILLSTPTLLNSPIGPFFDGWNAPIVTLIFGVITSIVGYLTFIKTLKPFENDF